MTKPVNNEKQKTEKNEYQMDVIDHPSVVTWLREVAKKDHEGFLRLIGPNVNDFKKIFGKPDWTNDGSKGWTHGWSLYENNMHWLILTGQNGTLFRIRLAIPEENYLEDSRIGVGIINYLNQLLKKLSN